MNSSIADYLKVVTPYLHSDLVSPQVLLQIRTLAQVLPASNIAALECRLAADQSQVDLHMTLPSLSPSRLEKLLPEPLWKLLQDFCMEWAEPQSLLNSSIDRVGLEFDLDRQISQVPIPSVFIGLNQEIVNGTQGFLEVAAQWYLKLLRQPISSQLESNLKLCADSLPNGATILHLGVMLSRPAQVMRVNVDGIHPDYLLDYLKQIGCKDETKLSELVSTLSEFADSIGLTFDIGKTILPKIGLALLGLNQSQREPPWQLFLDQLVAMGLCTPKKKDALLAWPGLSQKQVRPELWPANLTLGDRLLGSQGLSLFWRTINHLKIVYEPDSPLSAKGYLSFGHRWVDRRNLDKQKVETATVANRLNGLIDTAIDIETSLYLDKVRSYYDNLNPMILKHIGSSYQSILLKDVEGDPYYQTNLYCANQAGISPGDRVLDAGCGVCGPSIDIAQNFAGVRIDGITLSSAQANTARELVQQAGLTDCINVHVGSYHHLPFPDELFDVVLFLESFGYCYDQEELFAEVYRVLRPGGIVYIKEPFSKEPPLSEQEQQELTVLNEIFAWPSARISETIKVMELGGFENIISRDWKNIGDIKLFTEAIIRRKNGSQYLTEFGKFHYHKFYRNFKSVPIIIGEIKAQKPS